MKSEIGLKFFKKREEKQNGQPNLAGLIPACRKDSYRQALMGTWLEQC